MESDIELLELASGIKDSLTKAGFLTISSILNSTTTDISNKVGIDIYIAQIILEEARKVIATTSTAIATAIVAVNEDKGKDNDRI
jgi:ABC-type uncharacterized transport system substrate-binding protein